MNGANGARWIRGGDGRWDRTGSGPVEYFVPRKTSGLVREAAAMQPYGCSNAGVPLRRSSPKWLNINWIGVEVDSVNRRTGEANEFGRIESAPDGSEPISEPVSGVSTTHNPAQRGPGGALTVVEGAEGTEQWFQGPQEWSGPQSELCLLDAVPGLIVVFDAMGCIVEWNRACSELLGYVCAEVRGRPFWECLVPAGEAEAARNEFLELIERQEAGSVERYWQAKDGELKWICWSVRVQRTADGRIGSISASGLDRTAVRSREVRLMSIAADALVTANADQKIIGFERGAEQLFGWSASEVIGQPLERLVAAASLPAYHRLVQSLLADPSRVHRLSQRGVDFTAQRNGGEFAAEVGVLMERGPGGMEYTLVFRDISHRKQLETSLRREIRVRDELTRTIVHDLRNPLNSIALQAQLMVRPSDQQERRSTVATERIKRSVGLMTRLLDHLADVSRVQAGRIPLDKAPLDIGKALREAVDSALPQACVKNIRLRLEVEDALPVIVADPTGLLQVLHNLLGNALKFCPDEGMICVGARRVDEQLRVNVTNSGPVIPQEQQVYLFEPFWQGDPRSRGGAGLGLAIAKGIIEAHGGTIGVESSDQLGTTFFFSLPFS